MSKVLYKNGDWEVRDAGSNRGLYPFYVYHKDLCCRSFQTLNKAIKNIPKYIDNRYIVFEWENIAIAEKLNFYDEGDRFYLYVEAILIASANDEDVLLQQVPF